MNKLRRVLIYKDFLLIILLYVMIRYRDLILLEEVNYEKN